MSIRIFGLPIFLSVFFPYMAYSTGFAFRNLPAGASQSPPGYTQETISTHSGTYFGARSGNAHGAGCRCTAGF